MFGANYLKQSGLVHKRSPVLIEPPARQLPEDVPAQGALSSNMTTRRYFAEALASASSEQLMMALTVAHVDVRADMAELPCLRQSFTSGNVKTSRRYVLSRQANYVLNVSSLICELSSSPNKSGSLLRKPRS
ncbi:hypothetical protein CIB48_g7556 [Xylaria polymorpha]|nr:hypothetical protein CIB48_g7556 [Xylaria polymorpha]